MDHIQAQEIRDAAGNVIGYFMPGQGYLELRDGYEELRQRIRLSVPRATEEQEEEFRQQLENGIWEDGEKVFAEIIRDLEGGDGNA